jgi:glyoxylate utilization-related uncharacterized protein
VYKVLSDEKFQAYIVVMPPNSSVKEHFPIKKELMFAFITKGEISVTLNGFTYNLQEGDFLYIKKSMPEKWYNKGGEKAELLIISR